MAWSGNALRGSFFVQYYVQYRPTRFITIPLRKLRNGEERRGGKSQTGGGVGFFRPAVEFRGPYFKNVGVIRTVITFVPRSLLPPSPTLLYILPVGTTASKRRLRF